VLVGSAKPPTGTEIKNELLTVALKRVGKKNVQFKNEDWEEFGLADLSSDSYIQAGNRYFEPVATDTSEFKLATGMMSLDEWIHRGLEYAWKAWECRSEDRGGGGSGGESQEIAVELRWLDLAIDSFSKAGSSGQCLVSHCLILCQLPFLNKLSLFTSIC